MSTQSGIAAIRPGNTVSLDTIVHQCIPLGVVLTEVSMLITASETRETVSSWRAAGASVALVPTMGSLHAGHNSLVALAHEHADRVVMSIFVNPTQFGVDEDFDAYPRTLDEDRAGIAEVGGVDLLFVPDVSEIYPFGVDEAVRLSLPELSRELCGVRRPGHFEGVVSVVCRLLNIVTPDKLVLGRKDYQQLILVKRMIADLRLSVEVLSAPTLREPDGLAISSRNRYLSEQERTHAPALHAALTQVTAALQDGASDYAAVEQEAVASLQARGFRPEYVEVRRLADLTKPRHPHAPSELIVVAAASLGGARLIDNLRV